MAKATTPPATQNKLTVEQHVITLLQQQNALMSGILYLLVDIKAEITETERKSVEDEVKATMRQSANISIQGAELFDKIFKS